jgi:DNA-binding NarL/FixJ family response regulator
MATDVKGINVLLVEDHLALRKGLELFLRGEGVHVVGSTASVDEGLRMFVARRPHVAIIDVDLGGASGTELARRILQIQRDAGVLIYTGLTDSGAIEIAATSGARGFALKTCGPAQLLTAISTVAAGGFYVEPSVAATLAPRASRAAALSNRERVILDRLASGLTGEEVAVELHIAPETVRTHIRNAMRKLDAKSRAHAIAQAVRLREISL